MDEAQEQSASFRIWMSNVPTRLARPCQRVLRIQLARLLRTNTQQELLVTMEGSSRAFYRNMSFEQKKGGMSMGLTRSSSIVWERPRWQTGPRTTTISWREQNLDRRSGSGSIFAPKIGASSDGIMMDFVVCVCTDGTDGWGAFQGRPWNGGRVVNMNGLRAYSF